MSFVWDTFRQIFFIPKPTFTERELPDQIGRVFIVTGGYSGIGKELSEILYSKHATVYLAGRTRSKGEAAVESIKKAQTASNGRVAFLHLDLADLTTIKASVDEFLNHETRLDVLVNNAGVMAPAVGTRTAQDFEMQMGTNCVGPYLFTELLLPILKKTAAESPPGTVRITWASSLSALFAPNPGGIAYDPATNAPKIHADPNLDYSHSKAGNMLLATAFQSRLASDSIISIAWHPGIVMTDLQRNIKRWQKKVVKLLSHPVRLGAYPTLFAGWHEGVGEVKNRGRYVGPWGRFVIGRKDVVENVEGAREFLAWCEGVTARYR